MSDLPKEAGYKLRRLAERILPADLSGGTRHTQHYFRIGALIVVAFLGFLVVRTLLIPRSFGEYGFYRADNVSEQMEKRPVFGAVTACGECHPDPAKLLASGKHQTVQCQNCHAPLSVHIEQGTFKEAMPIDRQPALCLRCHRFLPSRPKEFPQIQVKEHTGLTEQELPSGFCTSCHPPHHPTPTSGGGHG